VKFSFLNSYLCENKKREFTFFYIYKIFLYNDFYVVKCAQRKILFKIYHKNEKKSIAVV